jgi:hypothetical protein
MANQGAGCDQYLITSGLEDGKRNATYVNTVLNPKKPANS